MRRSWSMGEGQWVKEAMSDTMLVAEVLLSLVQAEFPPPPSTTNNNYASLALQLEWSVRQRRSKQALKKKGKPTRGSPTTPLSWSGGTSVSGGGGGGADGPEESSRPPSKPIDNPRSKVASRSDTTPPMRSRKKKTLAELREEMSSHMKENKSLKNELEIIKLRFENLRTTNQTLSRKLKFEEGDESSKRMKLDHQSVQATETAMALVETKNAISDLPQQREAACYPASVECNKNVPNESSKVLNVTIETSFSLPDLNLPIEDDSDCEVRHGIS